MDLTAANDRIAIRELLERYADAVFQHDADAWRDCWIVDARWQIGDMTVTGREAIVAAWRGAMGEYAQVDFRVQPGHVVLATDTAEVRSYTRELLIMKDGGTRTISGQYDDELSRFDGGWRFAVRRFTILHDSGAASPDQR